jgi:hypothetical protein
MVPYQRLYEASKKIICYHGSKSPSLEFVDDAPESGNAWIAEYPDGTIFLTNSKERASLYGQHVYKCELTYSTIKKIKCPVEKAPEYILDSGILFELFYNKGYDVVAATDGYDKYTGRTDLAGYATLDRSLIKILKKEN